MWIVQAGEYPEDTDVLAVFSSMKEVRAAFPTETFETCRHWSWDAPTFCNGNASDMRLLHAREFAFQDGVPFAWTPYSEGSRLGRWLMAAATA